MTRPHNTNRKRTFIFLRLFLKTLDYASWSFFKASHGKGAADGVGGAVKRTLDDLVSRGTDIPNATIAFKMLKESEKNVKHFFIPEEEIREMQQKVPEELIALPGNESSSGYHNWKAMFCLMSRLK